jgi:hypothetical protein
MEGPIYPVTTLVAGKHPARAIAPMRRGRQTDDQESRLGIAEAGQWFPPVIFLPILPPLLTCHACAILNQARTLRASQNVLLKCRQCLHGLGFLLHRHVEQHFSSFIAVGEGLAPVICLYRSKLLCFTRGLSLTIATITPLDHGDGQLL